MFCLDEWRNQKIGTYDASFRNREGNLVCACGTMCVNNNYILALYMNVLKRECMKSVKYNVSYCMCFSKMIAYMISCRILDEV